MKLIALILSLVVGLTIASSNSYNGYKVFNVTPKNSQDADTLFKIQNLFGDVDFWDSIHRESTGKSLRVMVSPSSVDSFTNILNENQIDHQLIINNVESMLQAEKIQRNMLKMQNLGTKDDSDFNLDIFWEYDEIVDYLYQLVENYSDIASLEVIGQSFEGRDIIAIKISLNGTITDTNPIIISDGTIHAREWIATMVALNTINQLVANSTANIDLLDGLDWVIVPVLNPDGYIYTFEADRFWRKTRSINPVSTCMGADLNRNFNIEWDNDVSSDNPCSLTYRGTQPFSESEAKAMSELFLRYESARLHIALHSYGQYLLYPFGFDYVLIENSDLHEEIGALARTAIYNVNGTEYKLGNAATTLYRSSGNSRDFATGVAGIDMAFTIELPGGGTQGFDIPPQRIRGVVHETFIGFHSIANSIKATFG